MPFVNARCINSVSRLFAVSRQVLAALLIIGSITSVPLNAVADEPQQIVDINSADAATLAQQLNGVGAAKAAAIVAYREANGPFAQVEDLEEVKGIGSATVETNRDRMRVK